MKINILVIKLLIQKDKLSSNFAFGGIEKQKEKLENDGREVISYKVDLKKPNEIVF